MRSGDYGNAVQRRLYGGAASGGMMGKKKKKKPSFGSGASAGGRFGRY